MATYEESSRRSGHLASDKHTGDQIKDGMSRLFRSLKFPNKNHLQAHSDFATKIVHPTLGMDDMSDQDKREWWMKHGDKVKKNLESKRNGIVNAIKETFMRESTYDSWYGVC